jgi:hypothetical protein
LGEYAIALLGVLEHPSVANLGTDFPLVHHGLIHRGA